MTITHNFIIQRVNNHPTQRYEEKKPAVQYSFLSSTRLNVWNSRDFSIDLIENIVHIG